MIPWADDELQPCDAEEGPLACVGSSCPWFRTCWRDERAEYPMCLYPACDEQCEECAAAGG